MSLNLPLEHRLKLSPNSSSMPVVHTSVLSSLSSKHPKKLWASFDSLLSRTNTPILPTSPSPSHLATSFLNFFGDKIAKLHFTLSSLPASLVSPHLPPPTPPRSEEHT